MSLRSTYHRYGSVALTLHWLSAALILLLVPMGFAMASAPESVRLWLYQAHAIIGVTVGLLTLMRIAWWLAVDRRPQPSSDHSPLQRRLAKAVHIGFYGVLLFLTVSGIGMTALSNLKTALILGDASLLPRNLTNLPPRLAHGAMARLLIVLLVLHVLGALYHHWIKRDGTLRRMLPQGS